MPRYQESAEERLLRAIFDPDVVGCIRGCTFTDDDGMERTKVAKHGCLCGSCFWRIRYRLAEAPKIVVALRSTMVPIKAASYEGKVDGTHETTLPFFDSTAPEADAFFGILIDWAVSHATVIGGQAAASLPAAAWRRYEDSDATAALSSRLTAHTAGEAVTEMVRWFDRWGVKIAEAVTPLSVKAYHDDIVQQIARYRTRAGLVAPRARAVRARECDICFENAVEVSIPDVGPLVVRCGNCHAIVAGVDGVDFERDVLELVA